MSRLRLQLGSKVLSYWNMDRLSRRFARSVKASGCRVLRSGRGLTEVLHHLKIAESMWDRWHQSYAGMTAGIADCQSPTGGTRIYAGMTAKDAKKLIGVTSARTCRALFYMCRRWDEWSWQACHTLLACCGCAEAETGQERFREGAGPSGAVFCMRSALQRL